MDFSGYTLKFSGGLLSLALKEVDQVGFTETVFVTDATVVSTLVPEAGGYELTFELEQPFHYNGGNLMVEVKVQEPGNYATTYFWGTGFFDENDEPIYTPTYMYNENYSGEANVNQLSAFLPAADFTYTPGTTPQPTEKTGEALIRARAEAKKAKNFAEADRIRDELKAQGVELTDIPNGAKWKRV